MSHKANVLRTYRELLELIHCIPAERRASALAEARSKIRQGAGEVNAVRQSDLLKELVAKVSFLRASTPRTAWRHRAKKQATHFVFRGGQLVEGQGEAESRLGDGKMGIDEGYRKHKDLLKRQYFGREPPGGKSMF